jgi:hypothetical protein
VNLNVLFKLNSPNDSCYFTDIPQTTCGETQLQRNITVFLNLELEKSGKHLLVQASAPGAKKADKRDSPWPE